MSRNNASKNIDENLEAKLTRLSELENKRDRKQRQAEVLYEQQSKIEDRLKSLEEQIKKLRGQKSEYEKQVKSVESDVWRLEEEIDELEQSISDNNEGNHAQQKVKIERSDGKKYALTQQDEFLTDPMSLSMMDPDDVVPDPTSRTQQYPADSSISSSRPPSRSSNYGPLDITTNVRIRSTKTTNTPNENRENNGICPPAILESRSSGTLDSFLDINVTSAHHRSSHQVPRDNLQQMFSEEPMRPSSEYDKQLAGDAYPWSQQVSYHLQNTFRIQSFREHQKEIINSTLSGEDVFVIMRTGGGKSLTYQLPALIEGRGPERKVTFVISPLISLIHDQEEQMNQFVHNSATSFTSNIPGGNAEHARRWAQVRDPDQGICLVFITPEKVDKSNKLRNELQKLYDQNRLGRFVIDEAHCACQWGHDFRPDYAKLSVLKRHFPSIPIIAVTATASDHVRKDVCQILQLGTNYRFFRSTANRPNLNYSVRQKPDGKNAIVEDMASFIKEKHHNQAGIVYTFSRKEADNVAQSLCDLGISAAAYYSDVNATKKETIHRKWMRNQLQVVVATIAFGLGINKPDVRFVLHHTISKTLEAYYQESGRAGRDGKEADCVLYYSPKDVPRMMKMVHGTSAQEILWPMVRYGQASGNDAVCKAMILAHLGEPEAPDVTQVQRENDNIVTEPREVGKHAQTVTKLLVEHCHQDNKLTLPMLVKEWRMKRENASPCVQAYPPSGLSVTDCERIIVALLLEHVIDHVIVWNAYDGAVYLKPGRVSSRLIQSPDPKIIIRLPKKTEKKSCATSKALENAQLRKSSITEGEWLISKKPRKRKAPSKAAPKKKGGTKKAKTIEKKTKYRAAKNATQRASSTVIDLLSDDDCLSDDEMLVSFKNAKAPSLPKQEDESGSEYEFDG